MKRERIIKDYFEDMGCMHRMLMASHCAPVKPGKDALTRSQLGIMMIVAHDGVQTIKDLAQRFSMSSSAATQLVDALVDAKLLMRTEDTNDRRKTSISLTAKGKQKLEKARKERLASLTKLLKPLTDNEVMQLMTIQRKIVSSFERS